MADTTLGFEFDAYAGIAAASPSTAEVHREDDALVAALREGAEEAYEILIERLPAAGLQPCLPADGRSFGKFRCRSGGLPQGFPEHRVFRGQQQPEDLDLPDCVQRGV